MQGWLWELVQIEILPDSWSVTGSTTVDCAMDIKNEVVCSNVNYHYSYLTYALCWAKHRLTLPSQFCQ